MGKRWLEVEHQPIGLGVFARDFHIALVEIVGDVVESACASIDVDGSLDVFQRDVLADFQSSFFDKPLGLYRSNLVDGDGADIDGIVFKFFCLGSLQRLADTVSCLFVNVLLDAEQLLMALDGSLITSFYQSVNSLGSETQGAVASDVRVQVDVAEFLVRFTFHAHGVGYHIV